MLEHKEAIISHLSWVSLFLGFHTLGLYIHNDTVVSFGQPEKQILFEPLFAEYIQAASVKQSIILIYYYLLQQVRQLLLEAKFGYLVGYKPSIVVKTIYF